MKLTLFALILISVGSSGISQTIVKSKIVSPVIQQRLIALNGGARSSVGGKSRVPLKIDLPVNTLSWYYSFSTAPGMSGTANLNLAVQLATLAMDPTFTSSSMIDAIKVPVGSGSIDAYLLDQNNADLFMSKVDNDGGQFQYFREGSILNTKQGVVEIDEIRTGTVYLGLKNPSTFDGINVTIEVVAIQEIVQPLTDEQIQALALGGLAWKAFEREDYVKCLELSAKALAIDNTLGFVHFNIALSYLITGKTDYATEEYAKAIAITKKTSVAKETFEGAINDLKKYMEKFPSRADAMDILSILEGEAKSY